ncbi:Transcription elongation factor spt6 [Yamadazyma tenuis]|uniref:Transcription elongation factor spt6 n=1 Tax=Candida tenuis TaxID=2315449 RepID=UPI00279CF422|nr:Transcription elongation factor spt6 [Yamadazyma tenuis]
MAKEEEEKEIRDQESEQHSSEGEGDDVMNDDSSEEDEDEDDDEEAINKVREGFIVDEEDEEEIESSKKKKRKHKRKQRSVEDDALDEDDLELLMENSGQKPRSTDSNQFKRLKRAQSENVDEEVQQQANGDKRLNDFFSDDNESEGEALGEDDNRLPDERNVLNEFEDFIEEEDYSDEDEAGRERAQREREKSRQGPRLDTSKLSSVDRESLQQLFEVFGSGNEYDWALEAQEIEDDGNAESMEPTTLDEVFEHAELKERMLTEEDNLIRIIDIPERFQKYRVSLNYVDLDDEEVLNEKSWIGNILYLERQGQMDPNLELPFKDAVGKVIEFISKDSFEVPFIWTHRRDYLLHAEAVVNADGTTNEVVHSLLVEDDLWRIVKLDIEYHSLYEKRTSLEKMVAALNVDDDLLKDIKSLNSMVAIQDFHDYIYFTYSKEIKKLSEQKDSEPVEQTNDDNENGEEDEDKEPQEEIIEASKATKKHFKYAIFERIRDNVLYDAVEAYGITAKQFGENVQDQSAKKWEVPYRIHATDDPYESPEDIIERICEDDDVLFKDPKNAQGAVRKYYSESIFHNPRIRHEVRSTFKSFASVSVAVTEKGKASIDAHSPFYDIKYAINRSPADLVRYPDSFLRMLEAEAQGLVVLKVETQGFKHWLDSIFNCLKSDGLSDISEKWNKEREIVLKMAFAKLMSMISLNTKEDLRSECQRLVAHEVRKRFIAKLDQAPFTPFGFDKGTRPSVLSISFGKGDFDSAVIGVFIKDTGKIDQLFKSDHNPTRDPESQDLFNGQLKSFLDNSLNGKTPDVISISGYNAHSKKLYDIIRGFVERNGITVNTEDLTEEVESPPLVKVIWGQDETARLYQNSARARVELSDKATLVKYCYGVARYIQNPLLEYISLKDDILSLTFYEHQKLIPNDLVLETLETCFVDIVNMVGVEINEAVRDEYLAQLVPYVSGLGARKSSGLLRTIRTKLGSSLATRSELIEHELSTANIFINCSSFLYIPYDEGVSASDGSVELLDATRIHPEDYDLARKMAADALDLDEEDIGTIEEQGGIIYQLMQEGVNKVDELNLAAYGKELESKFGKKKYATLQSIKEELVNNYEELRRSFHTLDAGEVFQMLTGETTKSFSRNTIVPVTVTRVGRNFRDMNSSSIKFLKVTTPSLIQGNIEERSIPQNFEVGQGQVLQAVVLEAYYENFQASFSIAEQDIKRALQPKVHKDPLKWDINAEETDKQKEVAKERIKQAKTRHVQHPLFHNFNHKQAEEYLAPQSVGDCVIRPSSRGPQFLTVTWKVGTNLFQHLVVEERLRGTAKEYVVENKRYGDLDQLIFQHIQSMAKKVHEMIRHPKFREGTLAEVNEWLNSYTKANPKSSAYVFCYDHRAPGWFLLLFKVNVNTPITTWHVKTEADGFRLKDFSYPNMLRLCNGFKQTYKSQARILTERSQGLAGVNPQAAYGGFGY